MIRFCSNCGGRILYHGIYQRTKQYKTSRFPNVPTLYLWRGSSHNRRKFNRNAARLRKKTHLSTEPYHEAEAYVCLYCHAVYRENKYNRKLNIKPIYNLPMVKNET